MKTPILCALAICGATSVSAATVAGQSDVINNGGGIFTFVFDQVGSDVNGTGDGLSFVGGGNSFIASSVEGTVRQDHPANGGLGVLNYNNVGTDNLETSIGETLLLSFTDAVHIIGFTFNGRMDGNGHQEWADGEFTATSNGVTLTADAAEFDGFDPYLDPDVFGPGRASLCAASGGFCNTTSVLFAGSTFKGYLESITFQAARGPDGQPTPVPLPASLGFLFAGMAGMGIIGRKRRKA